MNSQRAQPIVFGFSLFLSLATLFLIFFGGLVTTTNSGLAVPDWPLSFGRVWVPMVGGIFYEHGHRLIATGVGLLTITLVVLLMVFDDRRWVKRAGWWALSLVIFQGALGGITVLMGLSRVASILHACMAQAFLALVVAITVWTSRSWNAPAFPREEPKDAIPLHQIAHALAISIYLQLIFGASLRHSGWGLIPHIAVAVLIAVLAFLAWRRLHWGKTNDSLHTSPAIARLGLALFSLTVFQIVLGAATYLLLAFHLGWLSKPFIEMMIITTHVTVGAVLLSLAVILILWSLRTKPAFSPANPTQVSDFFRLTKPGITLMSVLTALAGFILGSKGNVNVAIFFHAAVGIFLSAAGAGTLNMVFERQQDAQMKRTQTRPLPAGRLQTGEALLFGFLLVFSGFVYLISLVNLLTGILAALTVSSYLYIYTPLKKHTPFCTTMGAFAGALPVVMGWTAAANSLGIEAFVLFGILFFWQYPHFLSLAWLYRNDYANAGFQMLPELDGAGTSVGLLTGVGMMVSCVALIMVSLLPVFLGTVGMIYLLGAVGAGVWLAWGTVHFTFRQSDRVARRIFLTSLAYVPIVILLLIADKTSALP